MIEETVTARFFQSEGNIDLEDDGVQQTAKSSYHQGGSMETFFLFRPMSLCDINI